MEVIVITIEQFLQLKVELVSSITLAVFESLQNKKPETLSDWISINDAKKILNYRSKSSWQKLRDEGKVVFTQSGRKIQYSRKSLEEFLKRNKVQF
jgi:hypothetical protein